MIDGLMRYFKFKIYLQKSRSFPSKQYWRIQIAAYNNSKAEEKVRNVMTRLALHGAPCGLEDISIVYHGALRHYNIASFYGWCRRRKQEGALFAACPFL